MNKNIPAQTRSGVRCLTALFLSSIQEATSAPPSPPSSGEPWITTFHALPWQTTISSSPEHLRWKGGRSPGSNPRRPKPPPSSREWSLGAPGRTPGKTRAAGSPPPPPPPKPPLRPHPGGAGRPCRQIRCHLHEAPPGSQAGEGERRSLLTQRLGSGGGERTRAHTSADPRAPRPRSAPAARPRASAVPAATKTPDSGTAPRRPPRPTLVPARRRRGRPSASWAAASGAAAGGRRCAGAQIRPPGNGVGLERKHASLPECPGGRCTRAPFGIITGKPP